MPRPPGPPPSQPDKPRFDWEGLVGVKLFSWIAGIALALVAQPLDVGVLRHVRADHGVAEIDQHLGDAAHADAADADEVDRTDVARQFHGLRYPQRLRPDGPPETG